ncbi:MAG: hypothetical protein Q8K32_02535 [Archangium sp.]|nr:hypothetical protein [Archangium sp.]
MPTHVHDTQCACAHHATPSKRGILASLLDDRTLSRLEKLFDLQMWSFGCDARRAGGNLFALRGMRCMPAPAGSALSSTWSETAGELTIELSSAGVTVRAHDRTLTLQRGPLGPQLRDVSTELLSALASWVLTWEAWVDLQQGPDWRPQTLAQRRRPSPWTADELRQQWRQLAANLELQPATRSTP